MDNRMLHSSSSSSSSDEEDRPRRPRIFRPRNHPLQDYDDVDFRTRFRLSKESVEELYHLIGHHLEYQSARNDPRTGMNQLRITLRFYATGSFQICTGDHFNVSKASVCRIIHKVTHHIAMLRQHFIRMPDNQAELDRVKTRFNAVSGFPGVIGAIDCTHIRIQSPGGENGERYRNRKGWFSVNIQGVCDAELKFIDIVSRWPGSTHDSTIFEDSFLRARLENDEYPNDYLLGDSGYACKKYLLTPLLNPATAAENAYNDAQIRTRNVIERGFGVWKRRFPCLFMGLRVTTARTLAIIVATAILHNIAIDMNDAEPDLDENVHLPAPVLDPENVADNDRNNDRAVRTMLIDTFFNRFVNFQTYVR